MGALSTDEGRTWAVGAPIKPGMGRYSYPSLAQSKDGRIHLSYSFSRYDRATKQDQPAGIRHAVLTEESILTRGWPIDPAD